MGPNTVKPATPSGFWVCLLQALEQRKAKPLLQQTHSQQWWWISANWLKY
jgi:hypothetical protein